MHQSHIAIVGMACRFPGAAGLEEFWRLLEDGVDAVRDVPANRWDAEAAAQMMTDPRAGASRWAGLLDGIDRFDAKFFGISAREARAMDPQQRLLLEVTWEALESAGLRREDIAGSATDVFIGIAANDYSHIQNGSPDTLEVYDATGNALSIAANRLSYLLDLRGASMAVDTACSSSLTAVHLACRRLRGGDANTAIAGGANLILSPSPSLVFAQAGMLAGDGHCKTFDARADGYVRGEGVGVVVLKRLEDALRHGDPVIAVIRGSATNQDGRSNGLTAPNGLSQEAVIRAALADAGVDGGDVCYVEAHGTGTNLGDPIEAMALGAVLGKGRSADTPCLIGSVKTNIGHLEAASGIAGLIKTALSLQRRTIPKSLHFTQPNPAIDFTALGLKVQTATEKWPVTDKPLIAGVSAFGFGGSNAHVVLEAPPVAQAQPSRDGNDFLFPLSAQSEEALRDRAAAMAQWLNCREDVSLYDACFTASARRTHMEHRLAVVAQTRSEICDALRAYASGSDHSSLLAGRRASRPPKQLWRFEGDTAGLGKISSDHPVVQDILCACDDALAALGAPPLPANGGWTGEASDSREGRAAIQIALAGYWRALGQKPQAIATDAAGLPAALYAAGALSLEDALRLAGTANVPGTQGSQSPETVAPSIPIFIGPVDRWFPADPFQPASSDAPSMVTLAALTDAIAGPSRPVDVSVPAQWVALRIGAPDGAGHDADRLLLHALAGLYTRGCDPAWGDLFPEPGRVIVLPPYPWQHKSYWFEHDKKDQAVNSPRELRAPVALLFTGQGVDSTVGRSLYDREDVFRESLDRCDRILSEHLDRSVIGLLFDPSLAADMAKTAYAQPALCALEWSLVEMWRSWGLKPSAVMGHSLGEYVAACVAGCLSLEDMLPLVCERGRLMQTLSAGGAMASLRTGIDRVEALLQRHKTVSIAAVNGPRSVVISGHRADVEAVVREAEGEGIAVRYLPVAHGFHSAAIEPALPGLAEAAERVAWRAPEIMFITNVTGDVLGSAPSVDHWVSHARQTVLFSQGISRLYTLGCRAFLEIGPHTTLTSLGRSILGGDGILWASSLERDSDPLVTLSEGRHTLKRAGIIPTTTRNIDMKETLSESTPNGSGASLHQGIAPRNGAMPHAAPSNGKAAEAVLDDIRREMAKALGEPPDEINVHAPFVEMGADSLVLAQAVRTVESRYGVNIPLKRFFTDLATPAALAAFLFENAPNQAAGSNAHTLAQQLPAAEQARSAPRPNAVQVTGGEATEDGVLERVIARQLAAMTNLMQEQLRVLGHAPAQVPVTNRGEERASEVSPTVPPPSHRSQVKPADYGPFRPPRVEGGVATGLTSRQQQHVSGLISEYCGKTATSKAMAARYRRWYADSRASAGFRMSIKELLYPIAGARTDGAHLWDVDGNRYVDISMDFGVNLLGHGASVIRDAQREQWSDSIALGPRPNLAGEAAERLCRMTGMERAVFCQSGTEAVMTAIRLARLATRRQKIALFRNSYHGHSDGVLVGSIDVDGVVTQHPAVPGVPESVVGDVLLLDYGAPEALETIRRHGSELAAVLVEPVQSRHPELQPREFLHELQTLTRESGTLLIFDEMITGFRIAPGGAQEWFGVRADIATYGKILGGGVPIAAVAGRRDILDGIDGGAWEYGDASFPAAEVTFFAGTFCCNPLAMASAVAVLTELERQGPALQATLGERTGKLAGTLNSWFESEGVPIRIAHFGSLFRFQFSKNLDLFFFHLLNRGVFIWEGRNCFLSAAHTAEDIAFVIDAVKASVKDLRDGGFLAPRVHFAAGDTPMSIPMSAAQKQLWFLSQVQPEASAAYIEPVLLEIEGDLDVTALQLALDDLVARHESLRTTVDGSGEAQIVHPKLTVTISFTGHDTDPDAWLAAVLREPMDLVAGPLVRAAVLNVGARRHRFVLAVHHIVTDGWSLALAVSELAQFYGARTGTGPSPSGNPAQFREHIARQEALLQSTGMDAGRAFWSGMLAPPLPVLELPGDLQRPHPLGWSGGRHTVRISQEARTRAARYSAKEGGTLFMTLFAVYAMWLHRITGQEDLVIGYPTHGRELPAEESVAGYCVNILPLRLQVTEHGTFDEFVRRVRESILEIDDYKAFPFAEMLRALNMSWSEGAAPLIAATFNMDRAPEQFAFGTLGATLVPAPIQAAKYELSLNVTDTGNHLILDFDYNGGIFSPDAMANLAENFAFTLEELTARGSSELRLGRRIADAEADRLIGLVNGSPVDLPLDVCVHTLFERHAAEWPDRIAVVAAGDSDGDERLTYAELNERSDKLARRLRTMGVGLETSVGLCVDRSLDRIAGLIAILKAGGAYVPLSLDEPQDRRLRMLSDAHVDIVLTQRDGIAVFQEHVAHVICIEDDPDAADLDSMELPEPDPQNMACVLFTSGTTRHPKGVSVSHRNIANLILGLHARYPGADTFFHHSSLQFDASTLEIWWPLLTGNRLVVAPPGLLSPDKIVRLVARHDVNYLWLTTGLFQLMVEQALPGMQGIPHVMFGGEATSPRRVEEMRAAHWGGVLANAYGPTEGTTFTTTFEIDPRTPIDGPLPIGKPIDNAEVYILDTHGRIVPEGVAGELNLGGEGVTRCYLRQPALTAAAFVPDPFSGSPGARLYRTGDKARVRADGNLEFLGRIDTQIKLRGFRIEPGEIETALVSLDDVEQAIAVVREDTPGDRRLVAYVTPGARRPQPADVMDAVRELLPPYMMPGACVVLDKLPLTPNGKVDRKALPAPERNRSINREKTQPGTSTERRLYAIWSDILQVSDFGASDDFFALGGHSLLCMRMVAKVNDDFGTTIPLRTALDRPTVAGLAAEIDRAVSDPVVSIQPSVKDGGPHAAPRIRAVSRVGRRMSREALTRNDVTHE